MEKKRMFQFYLLDEEPACTFGSVSGRKELKYHCLPRSRSILNDKKNTFKIFINHSF